MEQQQLFFQLLQTKEGRTTGHVVTGAACAGLYRAVLGTAVVFRCRDCFAGQPYEELKHVANPVGHIKVKWKVCGTALFAHPIERREGREGGQTGPGR